jgi:two-component system response regulator DevR
MALMLAAATQRYCLRVKGVLAGVIGKDCRLAGKIRVMIVDDHERVRCELVASLGRCETVEVVGATGCAEEATRWLAERQPDVVLLDVKRDDGGGLDLCRRLTGNGHGCAVVVLTSYLSGEEWREAREAGATDYLFKQIDFKALLAKISEVAQPASRSL